MYFDFVYKAIREYFSFKHTPKSHKNNLKQGFFNWRNLQHSRILNRGILRHIVSNIFIFNCLEMHYCPQTVYTVCFNNLKIALCMTYTLLSRFCSNYGQRYDLRRILNQLIKPRQCKQLKIQFLFTNTYILNTRRYVLSKYYKFFI